MSVAIHEKSICEIFTDTKARKYIIPRYQREYAWGSEEIGALLTDLWESFLLSSTRKYYLGTLVVKQRSAEENVWEIIDGQQRLTTLLLLMRFMHKTGETPPFSFDTRQETNKFLADYYGGRNYDRYFQPETDNPIPESFYDAIRLIEGFRPTLKDGSEHSLSVGNQLLDEKRGDLTFSEYIFRNVVVFEVEMPAETDAMDYFEVMNNRGEQLEFHEMLKAELLTKLYARCAGNDAPETLQGKYESLSHLFNLLWTACSKMDGHLIDHLHLCYQFKENRNLDWTKLAASVNQDDLDESGILHERQSIIRDFSNFLMHVLRLYVANSPWHEDDAKEIVPLDERTIKKTFSRVDKEITGIDPVRFLQTLVIARLDYDKYVVKAKIENDSVVEWRLKEIVKRANGKSEKYEVKCTFGSGNEATEDERTQKKIVYLQSALQVSNASQRYKEWVYAILAAPYEIRTDGNKLLNLLESFAAGRIAAAQEKWGEKLACLGLQTPRLLFNIIDYLMWNASEDYRQKNTPFVFMTPRDFVFGYQNSIEHHHAQCDDTEKDAWGDEKDNIGNLYLTSSSENSSMGKHCTIEKVNMYRRAHDGKDPVNPKRNWMYVHTGENWSLSQMESLGDYVMTLVGEFLRRYTANEKAEKRNC